MKCPICGERARPWRDVEGIPILRCVASDCGFRFFDLAHWQPLQADYYEEWRPGQLNRDAPWIRARVDIVRKFKIAGRVAELGCGIGETAIALCDAGFKVVAVDESPKAIGFLRAQFPAIEWHDESLVEFIREHPQSFDIVAMFHVLEHIPRPEYVMRLVDQALRPGGVVVIEVPDVSGGFARIKGRRWDYFHRAHVNYFDTRSLEKLMRPFGFRRRLLQRTYHFSYPQGHRLKDLVKGSLARLGLNSIIRTAWTK